MYPMSLHCPKCDGLVYARVNRKCGHCGADLPAEFAFSEAELAGEASRLKRLVKLPEPQFPLFVLICWGITLIGWSYLAVVRPSRLDWLLAALWFASIVERYVRYSRQKKQFKEQQSSGL
jgi:hypothetical protein